ncbi:MAG: ATP-binding protein [Candidatus Rokubacteria bacterium]|nr:ATP-binding protein [Candidatus Rokubacteria bacterium]
MTSEKKFELHLPSVLGCEKVAMEFAASVAKSMNFPADRVEDLKTAVAEACINAIEHGNKMDAGMKVGISLTVAGGSLQVAVQDEGAGIGQVPAPNIDSQIEGKTDPRGWGIFLIKNLMDEVTFESTPEGRNVVKMIIHLKK